MATITLTDRISVRVTAKDSTETSNQNKTNGGNVASALGGSGLTDSEKEELGESLGETVTGEDGKTYARSDKVAGVLKQIKAAGKLSEPGITYEGLQNVNVPEHIYTGPIHIEKYNGNGDPPMVKLEQYIYDSPLVAFYNPNYICAVSKTGFDSEYIYSVWSSNNHMYSKVDGASSTGEASAATITINNIQYSYFCASYSGGAIDEQSIANAGYQFSTGYSSDFKSLVSALYGPTHSSGGAKVDPTGKTDSQIKKDLEDFAALNNCKMTSNSGDTYIAVTDANGNPLYFLGA